MLQDVSALILLIILVVSTIYYMDQGKKGNIPTVRRIPAVDAFKEAVGRAAELGRPVMQTLSEFDLHSSEHGPANMAMLQITAYVARLCAETDVPFICVSVKPTLVPAAIEVVSQAYEAAGVPEKFKSENIRFVSGQLTFGAYVGDIMETEKPAVNICVGPYQAASVYVAEVPKRHGAFVIGGCNRATQVQFFAVSCDYTLIGEEMFAVGAYLERDPAKIASLAASDVGKLIFIALILLGSILTTAGNSFLTNLLSL